MQTMHPLPRWRVPQYDCCCLQPSIKSKPLPRKQRENGGNDWIVGSLAKMATRLFILCYSHVCSCLQTSIKSKPLPRKEIMADWIGGCFANMGIHLYFCMTICICSPVWKCCNCWRNFDSLLQCGDQTGNPALPIYRKAQISFSIFRNSMSYSCETFRIQAETCSQQYWDSYNVAQQFRYLANTRKSRYD